MAAEQGTVYDDEEIRKRIKRREKQITELVEDLSGLHRGNLPAEARAKYDTAVSELHKLQNDNVLDRARIDVNAFAEFVMVDDETGEPLKQAPIHRRWADLCDQYRRLIIWSHVSAGKTVQLSITRTIWEIGRDPTLRCCILSNTQGIAIKIVKTIGNLIKDNEKVRQVFPHLVPDPEGPWTTTELKVVRSNSSKDPTVRAVGLHGALTSARVDRLIVDDVLDPECVDTAKNRQKVSGWFKSVAVGRLTRRAKILIVGNAFHPDDLLHELSKQRGWKWFRFPVITAAGKISWPEAWPQSRIDEMREDLGPAEFARQLLCKARDDDESRFKQEWINLALRKGNHLPIIDMIEDVPYEERKDWEIYHGVDIAVKKTKKADKTAIFTFAQDPQGNRRVLKIQTGKYTGPEIVDYLVKAHENFGGIIAVESNAAQDFVLQFTRERSNIPVMPHTTTRKKRDPILGVEGLAIELSNGKWAIPNEDNKVVPVIEEWINQMLFYSPSSHTGDTLMACYFARELARRLSGDKSVGMVSVKTLGDEGTGGISGGNEKSLLQQLFDVPS